MKTTVQARLDEVTQRALNRLVQRHGLSTSEIVREGIRLVEKQVAAPKGPRLIGAGMFDSGIPDLSTNRKYMQGLGLKRRKDAGRR